MPPPGGMARSSFSLSSDFSVMSVPFLALDIHELMNRFGIHTDAFIAHLISFTILVAIVVFFGIKPIMRQLEERRKRIEEGESMHARSMKELAEVKVSSEHILAEAHDAGKRELEHARQTASKLQADMADKATEEARSVLENARKQAELDALRERENLKGEFSRLVALATSQVTGKVLSEQDHRLINEEAIRNL